MSNQIIYTIVYLVAFFGLIQFSELLYHKFRLRAEITRKTAHIVGSLSSLSFLKMFHSHWYVFIIGLTFFILLLVSNRKKFYKSINLVERKSIGSFLLPISIYLLYLFYEFTNDKLFFVLPVLILGISDSLAGLVGSGYYKKNTISISGISLKKTYAGSITFFVTSFIITITNFSYYSFHNNILVYGLYFAFIITFTEAISSNGIDNITVPMVTVLLLCIMKTI